MRGVGRFEPRAGDALIVVDVQRDFLPGGALCVPGGDEILSPLNGWLEEFSRRGLPVFATRDWHPAGHCSFQEAGGPWPAHCVMGSAGAGFSERLRLPAGTQVLSKGSDPARDAYSGFDGTDLDARLRAAKTRRAFIVGLATDYCVRATAKDALKLGYSVAVIEDCVRAVAPAAAPGVFDELTRLGAEVVHAREAAR